MKRLLAFLIAAMLCVSICGCGEEEKKQEPAPGIDGRYITDTAYGMEDFYSEITVKDNTLGVYIEHYAVPVEEYSGTFTIEGNKILFAGEDTEMEFEYNPDEKTIYNDEMETTWVIEENFIPSKEKDKAEDTEEPDAIPENVRGEYVYSDDGIEAALVVNEGDYTLSATSEGSEDFEISGDAVYAGNQILMMDGENSVSCPLDEENGTIEYDGFLFRKK